MTHGRIYSAKEVHCGKCGEWRGGLGYYAATELKEIGWRQFRKLGWCCPACTSELAPAEDFIANFARDFRRRLTKETSP